MILGFVAIGPVLQGFVQAQPAPRANPPATKVELLFVPTGASGTFDGKTLTLKGVGPTLFFSDRPERVTGHLSTAESSTTGAREPTTLPPIRRMRPCRSSARKR
jgi:hypothetical protein